MANVVLNPGYETAGAGGADIWASWTEDVSGGAVLADSGTAHGGTHAASVTGEDGQSAFIYQDISVTPGTSGTWTFWHKESHLGECIYSVYDNTNAVFIIVAANPALAGVYTQQAVAFTAPGGCTSIRIKLASVFSASGAAYFDDNELEMGVVTAQRLTTSQHQFRGH